MVIDVKTIIAQGDLEVSGRLVDASNATLFATASLGGHSADVIYKPIAGERPLWDFPDGTLAGREVAAYLFSHWSGFNIVPFTTFRDGPYGPGAVQEWITIDPDVDVIELAQSFDTRLRNIVIFDAVINNTDRKIGHLLPSNDGHLFGCDHGVSFHEEDKLRTVLWQWEGQSLTATEISDLRGMFEKFQEFEEMSSELLTARELSATHNRIEMLLKEAAFPSPSDQWPAIPWPPI